MAKSVQLKVPVALNNQNRLCTPEQANKEQDYTCPSCQDRVILRKGTKKTPHFAHKFSELCNQETILHKTAKHLIVQTISDWKSGQGDVPILQKVCEVCEDTIKQQIPDKVQSAVLEHRMDEGFIVDVAFMVNGAPAAAVEIRASHAVDEKKAQSISIPFIELDVHQVIENPNIFLPIRDTFNWRCHKCANAEKDFEAKVNKISKQTSVQLPTGKYYRYGPGRCYKCNREIIIFAWPKTSEWDRSEPKVKPIPKTIQLRYEYTIGKEYWANTCPYCNVNQCDSLLPYESDSPFFHISCKDSKQSYDEDRQTIVRNILINELC